MITYYIFVIILLVPSAAYSYLDHGTGNILVYIVVSLIGALVFSLKGLFFAVAGRKDIAVAKNSRQYNSIVLFNDLKKYPNVRWDQDPDGTKSLSRSDIMISDTSSVRFDYVLLY
ncbi:MAG: hypothetical protein AB7V07_08525, partial [Candidatus Delongbacteria bacterium]